MEILVNRCAENENVIMWKIPSECSLTDYLQALEKSRHISKQIPHHVDVIIDMSAYQVLFADAFFEFDNTSASLSRNLRSVAIVGANIGVRTIISAFRQTNSRLGNKMFFAQNLPEAKKILCQKVDAAAITATQEMQLGLSH